MSVELRIEFPPEGMTARRLLMNFLAELARCEDIEILLKPECVMVKGPSEHIIEDCFNSTLNRIGRDLETSLAQGKIKDMPLHTNDRRWVFGKLGVQAPKGSKFCQLTSQLLKRAQLTWDELARNLRVVRETPNMIQLGGGPKGELISLPMPLLYERYQAKYEFLRGRSGSEMKFKGAKAWLYLLLAGFALGYCGNYITGVGRASELAIVIVPELTLSYVLADEGARSLIIRAGLLPMMRELNRPPRPAVAYMLYVACEFVARIKGQADILKQIYRVPTALLEMDRVSFTGQTFTLLERISMDFGPLLRSLARLDEDVITWIRDKCHKAIVGFRGTTEHYGDYVRLATAVFQALSGALDPADLCYYALRVVAEHETKDLDPATRLKKLRREGWAVRRLLEGLRRT
mgnify:CR=1 FL=1